MITNVNLRDKAFIRVFEKSRKPDQKFTISGM